MAGNGLDLEAIARERAAASEAIVNSEVDKRLIVAGPGTGKTYTFKQALSKAIADSGTPEKGLALTFIRNLVADLGEALSHVAEVFTLHGFCKHQMHRQAVAGLREGWDYYPALIEVMSTDLHLLGRDGIKDDDIERCLHDLDDKDGVVTATWLSATTTTPSRTPTLCTVCSHTSRNTRR
jgi:superfamily I DNA/RNA helicase